MPPRRLFRSNWTTRTPGYTLDNTSTNRFDMEKGKIHGRTTIRDVSRLADVSVATVSAVINGKPAVSETLTLRVRRAIEALNYQPDYLARSLRMQRSNILGIVMPQFKRGRRTRKKGDFCPDFTES